jgi:hypothetical protein
MVSKIATIGLLAVLVIALVGGSAYILLRPDDAAAARSGAGQSRAGQTGAGQNSAGQNRDETAEGQRGGGFQGGQRDQGQAGGAQGGNGFGGGEGVGQGRSEVLGEGAADHPVETRLTLSGRVVELSGDELIVQTDEGSVAMHLGPEWYWESEGIGLQDGDEVEVSGFYESDACEVTRIDNLTTGLAVTLRDDTGRPLWAGQGRGGRSSAAGG